MRVLTGLDQLLNQKKHQKKLKGQVAYLCHAASVDSDLQHGAIGLGKLLGPQLDRLYGPQHGFQNDVQDNMIESEHFVHPYFKRKIFSLYSETRSPTAEMLKGIDTVLVDLQDVGTRIYTYIYSMTLLMQECGKHDIKVIVLDRPNPLGGEKIEGNLLQQGWTSFVGLHPLPTRHGLTIGEVAQMAIKFFGIDCELEVIPMLHWKRPMFFEETGLPWCMPSPNMPSIESAFPFVGTVMYEGTNISEGRGTTRPLEFIGHPKIEPFGMLEQLHHELPQEVLEGCTLRPITFMPTFQKHAGEICGGFQIHVINRQKFSPWALCQYLCHRFYAYLGQSFQWKNPPYEYEYEKMPIDLINGTDQLRLWVEKQGDFQELKKIEKQGLDAYRKRFEASCLY